MREIIDKIRRDQNQMTLDHLDGEGSSDGKPALEKDKEMGREHSTSFAVAQEVDRSEEGSPKETSDQPLTNPSEERGFFSRSSSWA
nr:hypothetical protein [uncultured Cohaesibacter sp.]